MTVPSPKRSAGCSSFARDDGARRVDRAAFDLEGQRRGPSCIRCSTRGAQQEGGDCAGRGRAPDRQQPAPPFVPAAVGVPADGRQAALVLGVGHVAQRLAREPRQICGTSGLRLSLAHDRLFNAVPPRPPFRVIRVDHLRHPERSAPQAALDRRQRQLHRLGDLLQRHALDVPQHQHQALARAQTVEQRIESPERVAALGVHHHQLLVGHLAGLRQRQPATRASPAQLPLHDPDRERDDEAAQRLRLPQRADAREQAVEDLLRDVLDLGVGADGAAHDPMNQRRVALPGQLGRMGSRRSISARASSRSRAASPPPPPALPRRVACGGGEGRQPSVYILLLCREPWERIRSTDGRARTRSGKRSSPRSSSLRSRWPAPDWMYDRRLKCVASSIPLTRQDDARAAMAEVLPASFSVDTLAGASEGVRALVEKCGGLRAAQLLFWGGPRRRARRVRSVVALGDGTTVSLRIGLHDVDVPKERYPRLRDVFGIPQAPPEVDVMRLASFVRCVRVLARAGGHARRWRRAGKPKAAPVKKASKKKPAAETKTQPPDQGGGADVAPGRADRQRRTRDQRRRARRRRSRASRGTRRRRWRRTGAISSSTPSRRRAPSNAPDRWWTVLFHLRELDSRNDPEACFWRVVAVLPAGRAGACARAARHV